MLKVYTYEINSASTGKLEFALEILAETENQAEETAKSEAKILSVDRVLLYKVSDKKPKIEYPSFPYILRTLVGSSEV